MLQLIFMSRASSRSHFANLLPVFCSALGILSLLLAIALTAVSDRHFKQMPFHYDSANQPPLSADVGGNDRLLSYFDALQNGVLSVCQRKLDARQYLFPVAVRASANHFFLYQRPRFRRRFLKVAEEYRTPVETVMHLSAELPQ